MQLSRARIIRWSLAAAWATGIFVFSATPGSRLPGGFSVQAHLTEYAVLGFLLYRALRIDRGPLSSALLAVALASAYGITDEVHQSFVPMRTPDPMDWILDTVGASLGAAVGALLDRVTGRLRA